MPSPSEISLKSDNFLQLLNETSAVGTNFKFLDIVSFYSEQGPN